MPDGHDQASGCVTRWTPGFAGVSGRSAGRVPAARRHEIDVAAKVSHRTFSSADLISYAEVGGHKSGSRPRLAAELMVTTRWASPTSTRFHTVCCSERFRNPERTSMPGDIIRRPAPR